MPAPPVQGGAGPDRSGCSAPGDRAALGSSPVDCRSYTKPAQALDDSSSRPGWFPRPQQLQHSAATSPECLTLLPFPENSPSAGSIISRQRLTLGGIVVCGGNCPPTDQPHPRPRSSLGGDSGETSCRRSIQNSGILARSRAIAAHILREVADPVSNSTSSSASAISSRCTVRSTRPSTRRRQWSR